MVTTPEEARAAHPEYQVDMWPDSDRPKLASDNGRRILAIGWDFDTVSGAFDAACRRFPDRAITLRQRARVIRRTRDAR